MRASAQPRYSPSWSSGAFVTRELPVPNEPTQFERLIFRIGLEKRPDLWEHNTSVRKFAQRYYKSRYVPEKLLEAMGLSSGPEEFD